MNIKSSLFLIILTLLSGTLTAQKIRYYDANDADATRDDASYFIVQFKVNDTCWQKDFYHFRGPLIKKEQYKDQKNTVKNGYYYFYNRIGIIDSVGKYINNKKVGIWTIYEEIGDPVLEKVFENGILLETKDINIKKNDINSGLAEGSSANSVQQESSFSGSKDAWAKYLNKNLRITDDIVNNNSNFSGTAIVEFAVNTDGTIHDILLAKSMLYLA